MGVRILETQVKKVKVYVRLFDSTSFWGYVYVKTGKRVQDLMNDERKFIPLEKLEEQRGVKSDDTYVTVVLHKDGISYVEER